LDLRAAAGGPGSLTDSAGLACGRKLRGRHPALSGEKVPPPPIDRAPAAV